MKQALRQTILDGEYQIAYHGTATTITRFTNELMGAGADSNSALGLFLTELPESAVEYADRAVKANEGDASVIYAVAYPARKTYRFSSHEEFFGNQDEAEPTYFSDIRRHLIQEGYDSAEYEGLDDVIRVSLCPDDSVIVASLNADQALTLDSAKFDSPKILSILERKGWFLGNIQYSGEPGRMSDASQVGVSRKDRSDMINQWLEQFDSFALECDGMTRAISTALHAQGIEHQVHSGVLTSSIRSNTWINHYWIQLDDEHVIDLRARMWMGQQAPHGFFLNGNLNVRYFSSQRVDDFTIDPVLFQIITDKPITDITRFPSTALKLEAPAHPLLSNTRVVDSAGNPLRVFRGEHSPVDYETGVLSTRLPSISFSTCAVANAYATSANDKRLWREAFSQPRIVPCYLSIKRPVFETRNDTYIDYTQLVSVMGAVEATKAFLRVSDDVEATDTFAELANEYQVKTLGELINTAPHALNELFAHGWRLLDDPEFVAWCVEHGYDGAISLGSGESMDALEYRVFSPDQVISSITLETAGSVALQNSHVDAPEVRTREPIKKDDDCLSPGF